jgi:hypothetical protein
MRLLQFAVVVGTVTALPLNPQGESFSNLESICHRLCSITIPIEDFTTVQKRDPQFFGALLPWASLGGLNAEDDEPEPADVEPAIIEPVLPAGTPEIFVNPGQGRPGPEVRIERRAPQGLESLFEGFGLGGSAGTEEQEEGSASTEESSNLFGGLLNPDTTIGELFSSDGTSGGLFGEGGLLGGIFGGLGNAPAAASEEVDTEEPETADAPAVSPAPSTAAAPANGLGNLVSGILGGLQSAFQQGGLLSGLSPQSGNLGSFFGAGGRPINSNSPSSGNSPSPAPLAPGASAVPGQ